MMARQAKALAVMALAALVGGCSAFEAEPPPPFEVEFKVTSDPGRPLADAEILHNGKTVAKTVADGTALLKLRGQEGESFSFAIKCPEAYQSPPRPIAVSLRRIAGHGKRPEYVASCPPKTRTVVVAVRADDGADLPVTYLGQEIARTDESGAAHVMLQLKPNEPFQLALDTSGNDRLRPQNPVATFMVKDRDEVFTFDQKFVVQRAVGTWKGRPRGPTPLKTH